MEKRKNRMQQEDILAEAFRASKDTSERQLAGTLHGPVHEARVEYASRRDKAIGVATALTLYGVIFSLQFLSPESREALLAVSNITDLAKTFATLGFFAETVLFAEAARNLREPVRRIGAICRTLGIENAHLPTVFRIVEEAEARIHASAMVSIDQSARNYAVFRQNQTRNLDVEEAPEESEAEAYARLQAAVEEDMNDSDIAATG